MMDLNDSNDLTHWSVLQLKNFLRERKIKIGTSNKAGLIKLVSQCMASNFPVKDQNRCIDITVHNKLYVDNGLVRLPDPNSLVDWEIGLASVPDITSAVVESFFTKINHDIGIATCGGHSMALGKSLSLSGHVVDIRYHGISSNIGYCFVKADVRRQVHHREQPYVVWAILNKDTGSPHAAYCQCPGGYV